jgi:hypothetical protein
MINVRALNAGCATPLILVSMWRGKYVAVSPYARFQVNLLLQFKHQAVRGAAVNNYSGLWALCKCHEKMKLFPIKRSSSAAMEAIFPVHISNKPGRQDNHTRNCNHASLFLFSTGLQKCPRCLLYFIGAKAQQIGTNQAEVNPSLTWSTCASGGSCTSTDASIVLDSNWR